MVITKDKYSTTSQIIMLCKLRIINSFHFLYEGKVDVDMIQMLDTVYIVINLYSSP